MFILHHISLISLAFSFISIQCSPLTQVSSSFIANDDEVKTLAGESTQSSLTNRNAFAVILSSYNEIANPTNICQDLYTPLSQTEINENLALTYSLASDLLSYQGISEFGHEPFDFLVFVDDGISHHQKRHLRQIGVKVHEIKAAVHLDHRQGCAPTELKCNGITPMHDFIRSSNDIEVSEYDTIVLLDPYVSADPSLTGIFTAQNAQYLMRNHDSSTTDMQYEANNALAFATSEITDPLTTWMLRWTRYVFGSMSLPGKAAPTTEMFPPRGVVILHKPTMESLGASGLHIGVPETGYTSWAVCLV